MAQRGTRSCAATCQCHSAYTHRSALTRRAHTLSALLAPLHLYRRAVLLVVHERAWHRWARAPIDHGGAPRSCVDLGRVPSRDHHAGRDGSRLVAARRRADGEPVGRAISPYGSAMRRNIYVDVRVQLAASWGSSRRQMYHTDVLYDRDALDHAVRALIEARSAPEHCDIVTGKRAPQIVQIAGNDPDALVAATRHFAPYADGVDVNLGCPQTRAKHGHYGGYLLHPRDWRMAESLVSALVRADALPVSVKLRLCDVASDTPRLATCLAHAGAEVVTLHARHVAPNRRRARAAQLSYVRDVIDALEAEQLHASQPGGRTRVLSNGNVRCWENIEANLVKTRADGVMVGEPLLMQPRCVRCARLTRSLFAPSAPSAAPPATPLDALALYFRLCDRYPLDAFPVERMHQHLQYVVRALPPGRSTRALNDALLSEQAPAAMLARLERWTASEKSVD